VARLRQAVGVRRLVLAREFGGVGVPGELDGPAGDALDLGVTQEIEECPTT
jgi:hypothetical protein